MRQLIIIGAGGMGRSLYDTARYSVGFGSEFVIKGFVDDDLTQLDCFPNYPPIVGTITDYTPSEDEVFVCAIGGNARQHCIETLEKKGAKFINLIHNTAFLGTNVKLGVGNVIGAFVRVACDSEMGNHNLVQNFTTIGHDVKIGNFNRLDCYVMMVGGTQLQNGTNIFTRAVINHNVVVEDNAHVGALSFVIRRVKAGTTVIGNPATRLKS